ncbi:exonuclease V-like [Elysia marginata]|uniref:Exonuclease V-like n=1 Tax=Elysia marginata TaxID=1093978 RepID=A0AAV4H5A1_9GAST|nr:exonuclease V-like [Elysia marginata]
MATGNGIMHVPEKDETEADTLVIAQNSSAQDSFDFGSDTDEEELVKIDYVEEVRGPLHNSSTDTLECDLVIQTSGTPKTQFRPRYLIVSDFAKQHWCEMQLLYSLAPEIILLRAVPGEEVKLEESETSKAAKGRGSDIHLERELEVQVPVEVIVETQEDKWAVKLINLQQAVLAFCRGQRLAREVPVFGCPFGEDIFVFGIIDELCYDPDRHEVEISELKTRRSAHPPKKKQQDKDKYQVNLYAQLFNELVLGSVNKSMVASHLGLNLDTKLSSSVMEHVRDVTTGDVSEVCTFGHLLETVLSQVQSLCCIKRSRVEYIQQDDKSEILVLDFLLDSDSLRHMFMEQCRWWHGERGTTGVDIEDCWKCEHCQFAPLCEWRDFMAEKLSKGKKK